MAASSSSKAPRVEEEEEATEPSLDQLAPEILISIAEIVTANDDVLIPGQLGSLARSCKAIKEALKDAKDKLREILRVERLAARLLCIKCGWNAERMNHVSWRPGILDWDRKGLTAADLPTLTKVLKSEMLAQVGTLLLFANALGDEGAAAVAAAAAAGGLPRLKNLNLTTTQVGDAGLQALASAFADGACRELKWLSLANNQIGNSGVAALAAAFEKALPKLEDLDVHHNLIGDEGMKALAAASGRGRLAKLEQLNVAENVCSEEGVEALADAIDKAHLPSLQYLRVDCEYMKNKKLNEACDKRRVLLRGFGGG